MFDLINYVVFIFLYVVILQELKFYLKAIPRKFAGKLKKTLPASLALRGSSSLVWNVGLSMEDDTLFFKDGWQEFVRDHSLQENDTLLF